MSGSKGTGRKGGGVVAKLGKSNLEELKSALEEWRELRGSAVRLAQEIVNLRNQASYAAGARITAVLGVAVQPWRMNLETLESLVGSISLLREKQQAMLERLERGTAAWLEHETSCAAASAVDGGGDGGVASSPSQSSWGFDSSYTTSLLEQLKQQTLLELCAAETLTMDSDIGGFDDSKESTEKIKSGLNTWSDDLSIDTDTATTLLLCFTHPPYFKDHMLEALIQ